jgi:hypothetical protein
MYAMLGVALLLVAGGTFAGTSVIVDGASTIESATTAPLIEIVVYDGTSLPATVFAGCSEPDCMSHTPSELTGTVTHVKNYVAWAVDYGELPVDLYVDGKLVYSVRKMQLLVWNTRSLSAGPHTLVAKASNSAGVVGSSTPLTITVIK